MYFWSFSRRRVNVINRALTAAVCGPVNTKHEDGKYKLAVCALSVVHPPPKENLFPISTLASLCIDWGYMYTTPFLFKNGVLKRKWSPSTPVFSCISELIIVYIKTNENAHLVAVHVHWACVGQCKQEAECLLRSCRRFSKKKKVLLHMKNHFTDVFAWTDNKVELLLEVIWESKVTLMAENRLGVIAKQIRRHVQYKCKCYLHSTKHLNKNIKT